MKAKPLSEFEKPVNEELHSPNNEGQGGEPRSRIVFPSPVTPEERKKAAIAALEETIATLSTVSALGLTITKRQIELNEAKIQELQKDNENIQKALDILG